MSNSSQIQEIILRYLNGESSPEEVSTLQQWIEMSDENKAEFELIKNIWADSEDAALLPVDTEQAWQSLNTKITEKRK